MPIKQPSHNQALWDTNWMNSTGGFCFSTQTWHAADKLGSIYLRNSQRVSSGLTDSYLTEGLVPSAGGSTFYNSSAILKPSLTGPAGANSNLYLKNTFLMTNSIWLRTCLHFSYHCLCFSFITDKQIERCHLPHRDLFRWNATVFLKKFYGKQAFRRNRSSNRPSIYSSVEWEIPGQERWLGTRSSLSMYVLVCDICTVQIYLEGI